MKPRAHFVRGRQGQCLSTFGRPGGTEMKLTVLTREGVATCGPLVPLTGGCACGGRRGKAESGQAAALRWSGRRCAPTPLRCSVPWPVAQLTALTSFAAFKQAATSQSTKRAARAATSPALLGAPQARCVLPEPRFADRAAVLAANTTTRGLRGKGCPAGATLGATSSAGPGSARAQRALRRLTRRGCLNAANEVSAVSSAARPRTEQRSAVGAQRRPPPQEPPTGCPRRDAPQPQESGRSRMTATGPQPTPPDDGDVSRFAVTAQHHGPPK